MDCRTIVTKLTLCTLPPLSLKQWMLRTMPIAITIATCAAIVFYIACNMAYLTVLPVEVMKASTAVALVSLAVFTWYLGFICFYPFWLCWLISFFACLFCFVARSKNFRAHILFAILSEYLNPSGSRTYSSGTVRSDNAKCVCSCFLSRYSTGSRPL